MAVPVSYFYVLGIVKNKYLLSIIEFWFDLVSTSQDYVEFQLDFEGRVGIINI